MHPRLYFTKFVVLSLMLHGLLAAAALVLLKPMVSRMPAVTPVEIVNLPPQAARELPPLQRPPVAVPPVPKRFITEQPLSPEAVPMPKKFGDSDDIRLPKTLPPAGVPEGADRGKPTGKGTGIPATRDHKSTGPLPFLTQNDIEDLARKGMPEKKPGDNSVTLDTDEFKFISYNRWLKIKVESVLKYPEIAAHSGYQGTLYIQFDIMKNGSLGNVEVLKSSGYKILDDEAMRAIRNAAPFQPLPDDWGMEKYSIRAAVLFYLSEAYIR